MTFRVAPCLRMANSHRQTTLDFLSNKAMLGLETISLGLRALVERWALVKMSITDAILNLGAKYETSQLIYVSSMLSLIHPIIICVLGTNES